MSDEVFSTTLAYTKSPKVTKRTTFQDELIKAITARSAKQRSSEYSDDFDSDEIVSLGDFSDTSVDENSAKKKMNDFHISDDEEKNSPKLSFLKTKRSKTNVMKDESVFSMKNEKELAPDGSEDVAVNPLSEPQNKDHEIETEKIKVKPKPRILPVKSTSSVENSSSLEADSHVKPSPRPRSMLRKRSLREETDGPGEDKKTAHCEESEAHCTPSSLPRLDGRQLAAEKQAFSENLGPEDPWLTRLSSSAPPKESLGESFSPEPGEKASVKDQTEELTESHNSLKSNENEENSFLIDLVTTAFEKSKESQVITNDLKEEKEKAESILNDDLIVDPPVLESQGILISTNAAESAKKTIEDRNLENKKSTNNRASSASGRLMTTEFLKKSTSVRRSPLTTTSSHYLGTLKVLDQKPSLKQKTEPDRADNIRAAVYQEWLEKKNVYLHEMHRIKRIESENLRIQNEQKRVAKREEALASFEAWKAMKEKEAKKIAAKKRLEDKNKKKTEEENAVRKGEALQAFERWKEKKMEYLKEKNKKEKEYERAKKQKEEEIVAEKRKDNLTAVEKWNERKEAFFKEKEKEKINEKRKEELKRAEKRDKDKQAIDEYEKWLEKKERQERIERKQKKHHSFLENETLPPWSPPSQTVFSKVFR
ncbi:microtubule-associated protein 9 isoform X1 [Manis pentadactyla]|uniref:microtubule-associated protein 9 isoform X1 n=1 Tax=Manis pentadactyla TaxID=143292 RepID=UPI00255C9362|nr:microtubule-associated protein 9 isoform X1 [Manis pentadactyla]XP_036743760.2 microtubule-associated protein 9 isoform X1 [Manis pentadactyla]XP_036743761.2 microtubule-associated protein 9 isoform X1 [Manis pentadactyla]